MMPTYRVTCTGRVTAGWVLLTDDGRIEDV